MLTGRQLRAARALLGMDQRALAMASGVSLATIRRMEGSAGTVRSNVDSLVRIVETLDREGVTLIAEGTHGPDGGRGVRLKA